MKYFLDISDADTAEEYEEVIENLLFANDCSFALQQIVSLKDEESRVINQESINVSTFVFSAFVDMELLHDDNGLPLMSVTLQFEDVAQMLQAIKMWQNKNERGTQRFENGQTAKERANDYYIKMNLMNMELENDRVYIMSFVNPVSMMKLSENNTLAFAVALEDIQFGIEYMTVEQVEYEAFLEKESEKGQENKKIDDTDLYIS